MLLRILVSILFYSNKAIRCIHTTMDNLDVLNPIDENDADVIRRRRLEHYGNRFSSTPTTGSKTNEENNNDDS